MKHIEIPERTATALAVGIVLIALFLIGADCSKYNDDATKEARLKAIERNYQPQLQWTERH